jgi:hypothetical protein
VHGLIFVVDSADSKGVHEARDELHKLLDVDELKVAILLVYANKKDLPDAIRPPPMASAESVFYHESPVAGPGNMRNRGRGSLLRIGLARRTIQHKDMNDCFCLGFPFAISNGRA